MCLLQESQAGPLCASVGRAGGGWARGGGKERTSDREKEKRGMTLYAWDGFILKIYVHIVNLGKGVGDTWQEFGGPVGRRKVLMVPRVKPPSGPHFPRLTRQEVRVQFTVERRIMSEFSNIKIPS